MSSINSKLVEKIVEYSGGEGNIISVTNCMTRIRMKVKDETRIQSEKLKGLEGISGVVFDDTMQIIVGPGKANKIAELINEKYSFKVVLESDTSDLENRQQGKKQKGKLKQFLKIIANIFIPILPGLIVAGTFMGINNIIVQWANSEAMRLGIEATNNLSEAQVFLSSISVSFLGNNLLAISTILGLIGNALFNFLAIYTGINAAKEFNATPIFGGLIGAMTIAPQLEIINITPGNGGLIGVIIAVAILSFIERKVKKIVPDILQVILTPILTITAMAIILFYGIMPFAGLISDLIIGGLSGILKTAGPAAGFLLSSLFPSLISLGLHHGLAPIHMEFINSTGTTPLFTMQIMSNGGMVGAAIAVFMLTTDEKLKEVAKGAIPTSILAVGEPTIFGVNIPAGFAFITGSIGAGFGGIMISLLDVEATAYGAAGLSALPLIADGKYLQYILSWATAVLAAFIITYFVGKYKNYQ